MSVFLRVSALCVLLSAITVFSGYSKKSDNWLIGKWAFDLEATKANIPADNKAQGVPDSVAKKMGDQLTSQLISQMVNMKFHITAEKFTSISVDGTQKSSAYNIVERPDINTIVLEGKDGETSKFTKDGKYICMSTTGAVEFNLYFKPVN